VKKRIFAWLLVGTLILVFAPIYLVRAQEESPAVSTPGDTYTYDVVKGDTLWGICEQLYGDPWVWPKVWQLNPHITNPHWIYPGNQLEVYRELPKTTVVAKAGEPATPIGEVEPAPTPLVAPPPPPPAPAVPTFLYEEIDQVGFITPTPPRGVGRVLSTRDRRDLIGMGDEVYLEMREPTYVGDRYYVFRSSDLIFHPATGAQAGYLNTILGVLETVQLGQDFARARILRAYRTIERGDKLMPYSTSPRELILRYGSTPLEGYIIASEGREAMIGERQIAFIDLGEKDGIEPGNRFVIYRKPTARNIETGEIKTIMIPQPIGEILVLAVEESTSAALITSALTELFPGDHVRLITRE
jgi:hypothetical protein